MHRFVLGAVAFAWWKGGRPERIGALFNAVVCLGVTIFQALSHKAFGTVPILVADGILATGFLFLAFRYASLWLATAMLLQAAAFSVHGAVLMELMRPNIYFYLLMNLTSAGVIIAIIAGTAAAWLRARHHAHSPA